MHFTAICRAKFQNISPLVSTMGPPREATELSKQQRN